MNFSAVGNFDPMKTVELGYQSVRVTFNMCEILMKDFPQEFVFCMMNGFDDVFVISREVKEAATFSWRSKFGEDVFAGQ